MRLPKWGQSLTPTENVGRGLSSATHFLHSGLSDILIKCRFLRSVLCRQWSPVTTLDCILLTDRNLTLVSRQVPDISSQACRWELPRFCQRLHCWFPSQRLILFLRTCLETPRPPPAPQTQRQRRSSRARRQFYRLSLLHAQETNIVPQHTKQRYHLMPLICRKWDVGV
jgi:hypothetical protein